jgi:hypothetical protein
MGRVLIVYHTLSGNTEKMAQAYAEGAKSVKGREVVPKKALDATLEDLLGCDAIALGSAGYFSYIAGALKDSSIELKLLPRVKWQENPTLRSPPEGVEERRLLRCLIVYAAHLNSIKLLKVWLLREHRRLRSWQRATRPERNWRML